jgi:single-strand DNA-binding protein
LLVVDYGEYDMLNKVILIGRLANEPELNWTPSGIPVTKFRLAVDRPISAEARQAGQEKQADFIDIVAWRQAAEFASNYLGKGRLVAIDGRLQIRQYVGQDGVNRRAAEVIVEQLKSLDKPKEQQPGDEHADHTAGYAARPSINRQAPPAPQQAGYAPQTHPAPAGARPATNAAPAPDDHGAAFASAAELDDPFADE